MEALAEKVERMAAEIRSHADKDPEAAHCAKDELIRVTLRAVADALNKAIPIQGNNCVVLCAANELKQAVERALAADAIKCRRMTCS